MEKLKQILMAICYLSVIIASCIFSVHQLKKKEQKEQLAIIDIQDREHGICAPMYEEGFNWGKQQYWIDWQTEHWSYEARHLSRLEMALEWYQLWENHQKN